jgi:hypothetical protein
VAAFPTLSTGNVAMYPLVESIRTATHVVQFGDGSEQRWRKRPSLRAFELRWTGIKKADVDTLETFFINAKGAFDTTHSLVLSGVTYSNLAIDTDDFVALERTNGVYDIALRVVQVKA